MRADIGGKSVAFGSEDDVFEYVAGSFSNKGSSALYAMEWFITGEYEGAGLTGWAQPSVGSGGFYASQGYDFDELSRLYSFAKESNPERILPSATELLRESWGVCASLGFYSNGPNSTLASAHTITVWGYEVDANYSADDPRYYKALLVTDSDDGGARGRYAANELKTYAIQWNDAYERYSLVGYDSSRTPWLEEIVCLAPRSSASNHVAATYAGYTAPTTSHALALSPSKNDAIDYLVADYEVKTFAKSEPRATSTYDRAFEEIATIDEFDSLFLDSADEDERCEAFLEPDDAFELL